MDHHARIVHPPLRRSAPWDHVSLRLLALSVAALLAAALHGCGPGAPADAQNAAALPAPARQVIVALDLSGSQSDAKRQDAQRVLAAVIDGLQYGDQIVLVQVHEKSAAEDQAIRWLDSVPVPRHGQATTLDRERLESVRTAARKVAANIFTQNHAGRLQTTDLLSTLHVAGEFMRDANSRRTTIVLLSDMLQSANGIDMERPGGVPSPRWIARQQEAGMLPSLVSACVAVVGADATTAHGAEVRNFWKQYFTAAGAELPDSNYRLLATSSPLRGCG